MTFVRSASGLTNLHQFYNVDVVIFVEGGSGVQQVAVPDDNSDLDTDDIFFWQRIARRYFGRFHIKSVGSKKEISKLAGIAIEHDIRTIIICKDSDFDKPNGEFSDDPRVIATWGYSWENDALQVEVVQNVLFTLVARNFISEAIVQELQDSVESFLEKIHPFIALDRRCVVKSEAGLFDRSNPKRMLVFTGPDAPFINNDYFVKRVAEVQEEIVQCEDEVDAISAADGHRYLFGHFWAAWMYHSFKKCLKNLNKKSSIRQSEFYRLAIDMWDRLILEDKEHPISLHYCKRFTAVVAFQNG